MRGSRPGSGGGHGGNGGRAAYQLQSSLAYDSVYTPKESGSGGGGGAGGGIVYVNITNMFRLEGSIRANGLGSNIGGGGGGSVIVWTKYFDGMGVIEAKGGDGAGSSVGGVRGSGGGGGGGRIAVYHSDVSTFIGGVHAFGGESWQGERGGAGTVYVQDESGNSTRRRLIIDNGHSKGSFKINEIRQVLISGNPISPYYDVVSYTSSGGIQVKTTGAPWCAKKHWRYPRTCTSGSGQLSNLLSGSTSDVFYYTSSSKPILSYTFPHPLTIDHVRVFPQCDGGTSYKTDFRVQAYLGKEVVYNQTTWTYTGFCRQGEYGKVVVDKEVDKVCVKKNCSPEERCDIMF